MSVQHVASVSGVFPTDGPLHRLEIRLQAIQLSPCRAGPSTHRSLRLDATVDLLSCSRSLILSEPGKTLDPETSSQVSPDYIGNTTERLVAQRPVSTRFEPVTRLRSFTTGSSRIPSDLARRTQPIWQYQTVPALSALLTVLPGVPRVRLRSAPAELLRQLNEKVLHLLRFPAPHGALRPHVATPISRSPVSWMDEPSARHRSR
jgi:hypothetical protein